MNSFNENDPNHQMNNLVNMPPGPQPNSAYIANEQNWPTPQQLSQCNPSPLEVCLFQQNLQIRQMGAETAKRLQQSRIQQQIATEELQGSRVQQQKLTEELETSRTQHQNTWDNWQATIASHRALEQIRKGLEQRVAHLEALQASNSEALATKNCECEQTRATLDTTRKELQHSSTQAKKTCVCTNCGAEDNSGQKFDWKGKLCTALQIYEQGYKDGKADTDKSSAAASAVKQQAAALETTCRQKEEENKILMQANKDFAAALDRKVKMIVDRDAKIKLLEKGLRPQGRKRKAPAEEPADDTEQQHKRQRTESQHPEVDDGFDILQNAIDELADGEPEPVVDAGFNNNVDDNQGNCNDDNNNVDPQAADVGTGGSWGLVVEAGEGPQKDGEQQAAVDEVAYATMFDSFIDEDACAPDGRESAGSRDAQLMDSGEMSEEE